MGILVDSYNLFLGEIIVSVEEWLEWWLDFEMPGHTQEARREAFFRQQYYEGRSLVDWNVLDQLQETLEIGTYTRDPQ